MKKFTILVIIFLGISNSIYAKKTTETIGDILSIAVPVGAYGTSLYLGDKDGKIQFYKSYGSTMGATYILKYTVKEKRPDSDNTDSFLSAHTSSTFAGYSRVYANRHHPIDVYAGAALGILSSWYFVSPYKNLQVTPIVDSDFKELSLSYQW